MRLSLKGKPLCHPVAALCIGLTASAYGQSPDGFNPGADNSVRGLAVQTDGKVVVTGLFELLGRAPSAYLGRLNADGSVDTTFNASADSTVDCIAAQPDGKILAGGEFGMLGGQTCSCLGRLNTDGSLDTNFSANVNDFGFVYSLGLQADGKVLAGGEFSELGGQPCSHLGRLNPGGTLDTGFGSSADGSVLCIAIQADGKVLAGGLFGTLDGQPRARLGRLNSDGTLDTNFTGGADGTVCCLAVQPDGKILVGGNFANLAGSPCAYLGRLNTDGTLDRSFYGSADGPVYSLAVQADGQLFVGGSFATLSGEACANFGRISADGYTFDPSFSPGADQRVLALGIQPDGSVLVGGDFQTLVGAARSRIGRVSNTDSATQSLTFDAGAVTWLRGGAGPEVWNTAFDFTTNGSDWTSLGAGTRISGGWQVAAGAAPATASIRARGYLGSGRYNGSAWYIETVIGPVIISRQPASVAADAGAPVTFNVQAGGSPAIGYQWRKDGANLNDGAGIAGAQTATLVLTNVLGGSAGGYSVVVMNSSGSATSIVATLTVRDPVITAQPVSQEINAGQMATFDVTAVGTPALLYQWRKNATNYLSGATNATLTLTNAQGSDNGKYDVTVTSSFGSRTSAVAVLKVDVATADAFDPEPNSTVFSVAVQADGRIVAGGQFTNLAGLPCSRLGRLNSDGSLDTNFNASASGLIYALALQPDGKLLAGGVFTNLDGHACTNLGRLNADGSLDATFNASATGTKVSALLVQTDGKILVGGLFNALAGLACTNLGRLNPNGTLDTNFNAKAAAALVYSLAMQPDGKLLVGGSFTKLSGLGATNIARLNTDGTLDTNFTAGANGIVDCLAVQADGKLLAGGSFTLLDSYSRNYIGRLNSNGTLDLSFNPNAGSFVLSLALQADGNMLVGGQFNTLGGQPHTNFGRLSLAGTVDPYFDPRADGWVYCLALQADGAVLAGGNFKNLGGQPRNALARLNNTSAATQSLACDGTTATWLRGGSGPEIWRVSFDSSTDGSNWTSLGSGTRIAGGWQLTGLSLPNAATLRARGFVSGGYDNGSAWFVQATGAVQAVSGPQLTILVNDGNFGARSNRFGFNLSSTPGQLVVIEATTDFLAWTPMQTNITTGTGLISFSDPQYGLFPRRFYRARLFTGTLPPPRILVTGGSPGFQGSAYGFNLSGIGGQTVVIQASTNLLNWVPLATNVLGNTPLYFSDPAATNFPRRFYRALVQ